MPSRTPSRPASKLPVVWAFLPSYARTAAVLKFTFTDRALVAWIWFYVCTTNHAWPNFMRFTTRPCRNMRQVWRMRQEDLHRMRLVGSFDDSRSSQCHWWSSEGLMIVTCCQNPLNDFLFTTHCNIVHTAVWRPIFRSISCLWMFAVMFFPEHFLAVIYLRHPMLYFCPYVIIVSNVVFCLLSLYFIAFYLVLFSCFVKGPVRSFSVRW